MPKPFFVLAPMDDVTDTVFRQVIHNLYIRPDDWAAQSDVPQGDGEARSEPYMQYGDVSTGAGNAAAHSQLASKTGFASQQGKAVGGPDLYFTEFVNVDGLMSPGRPKLMKKLRFTAHEGPLVAQLWGLKPENFEVIARQIADGTIAKELGLPEGVNYVGVDINMGCPAKSEVQNGACSALIKNRPLAQEIIEATKRGAGGMPVSVKTRLGFNEIDLTWHEFLLGFELNMLTVHWRTRKEMSKVPAHWEYAPEVIKIRDKIAKNTLIVGNGDVTNRVHGKELARQYSVDGVMIGRGVFQDPFVFAEHTPWESVGREERIALYRRHVEKFAETWQHNERPIHTLNKFCKVYINGFDGAKELREQLMQASSADDLLALLQAASQ